MLTEDGFGGEEQRETLQAAVSPQLPKAWPSLCILMSELLAAFPSPRLFLSSPLPRQLGSTRKPELLHGPCLPCKVTALSARAASSAVPPLTLEVRSSLAPGDRLETHAQEEPLCKKALLVFMPVLPSIFPVEPPPQEKKKAPSWVFENELKPVQLPEK